MSAPAIRFLQFIRSPPAKQLKFPDDLSLIALSLVVILTERFQFYLYDQACLAQ
jgi:hypothetical protein